jgi:hypothetical protein
VREAGDCAGQESVMEKSVKYQVAGDPPVDTISTP